MKKNIVKSVTGSLICIYTVAVAAIGIMLFIDVCLLVDVGRALPNAVGMTAATLTESFWNWVYIPYRNAIECGVLLIVAVNCLKALITVYEREA